MLETEEDPAIPARAGDGPGNGRQRFVGPALPFEPVARDGDAVFGALPFADQPGADDGLKIRADPAGGNVPAVELLAQVLQAPDGLRLQSAMCQLLNAVT